MRVTRNKKKFVEKTPRIATVLSAIQLQGKETEETGGSPGYQHPNSCAMRRFKRCVTCDDFDHKTVGLKDCYT